MIARTHAPQEPSAATINMICWRSRRRASWGRFLTGVEPFVLHVLDARPETRLAGRFWIPEGAKEFHGMAVKLSRVGHPGPLEARFGSAPGKDDLGVARLDEKSVLPLFESFEELRVASKPVRGGQAVYYELRATGDQTPLRHITITSTVQSRLGGNDWPAAFRPCVSRADGSAGGRPVSAGQTAGIPAHQADASDPLLSGRSIAAALRRQAVRGRGDDRSTSDGRFTMGKTPMACCPRRPTIFASSWRFVADCRCPLRPNRRPKPVATIELLVSDDPELRKAITTEEGYRVDVRPERIVVSATTPRGVMRGVYWIEDRCGSAAARTLPKARPTATAASAVGLTHSVHTSKTVYEENSHPLVYSDALLRHISHQGFNAIYVWTNLETMATQSKVFPELDDPAAPANYARLAELIAQAKPLGIDVFCHLATNHHRAVPESFYAKHPDCRGVAFANRCVPAIPQVREYLAESIRHLFQFAPGLKGVELIYDCEGFMHCGIDNKADSAHDAATARRKTSWPRC